MLIVAGLLEPTHGDVAFDGEPVTGPRTDIGIMFQDNTLVPWRTVRGNVDAATRAARPGGRRLCRAHRGASSDPSASTGFAARYPYELSGGMQQRAAFCQAMVHEPETLLLDEPLGKLDAMTRESIRIDLQALWLHASADRPFRHPLDRGSGSAVEPHLRDHAASRSHRPHHRYRPPLSARPRGQEEPRILRPCPAPSRKSSMATASSSLDTETVPAPLSARPAGEASRPRRAVMDVHRLLRRLLCLLAALDRSVRHPALHPAEAVGNRDAARGRISTVLPTTPG